MFYHPVTFGWILGEVARRVDGRAFQPFIEDEICRPLGITTMFAGVPAELEPRVAFLEAAFDPAALRSTAASAAQSRGARRCALHGAPLRDWMNRPDARRACIPASNGIMSARAVARHYAALLPGGVDGVELLPPERIRLATRTANTRRGLCGRRHAAQGAWLWAGRRREARPDLGTAAMVARPDMPIRPIAWPSA